MSACIHYPSRHSLNPPNFGGVIAALTECIYTISGVGTSSFTIDPSGYSSNFEGIVQAIEDLNVSLSGIQTLGINISGGVAAPGSGIYFSALGSGIAINVNYNDVYTNVVSGHVIGIGSTTVTYSGESVIISGQTGATTTVSGGPPASYNTGDLWFDTNQGRLFVYASGASVSNPDWYQTNAEALANIGDYPPSGIGVNAPARDGSLWFNTLFGSLFIYDATSSGWYETQRNASAAYGITPPAPDITGSLWYDTTSTDLKIWNGTTWTSNI